MKTVRLLHQQPIVQTTSWKDLWLLSTHCCHTCSSFTRWPYKSRFFWNVADPLTRPRVPACGPRIPSLNLEVNVRSNSNSTPKNHFILSYSLSDPSVFANWNKGLPSEFLSGLFVLFLQTNPKQSQFLLTVHRYLFCRKSRRGLENVVVLLR
jgi:hypothetical protein